MKDTVTNDMGETEVPDVPDVRETEVPEKAPTWEKFQKELQEAHKIKETLEKQWTELEAALDEKKEKLWAEFDELQKSNELHRLKDVGEELKTEYYDFVTQRKTAIDKTLDTLQEKIKRVQDLKPADEAAPAAKKRKKGKGAD